MIVDIEDSENFLMKAQSDSADLLKQVCTCDSNDCFKIELIVSIRVVSVVSWHIFNTFGLRTRGRCVLAC